MTDAVDLIRSKRVGGRMRQLSRVHHQFGARG
jgi:hypothetical protein